MKRMMLVVAAAVVAGAEAVVAEKAEAPYDFRKRLEVVHEAGRRDPAAKPAADEFVFADGAVVSVPKDADEVLALAAKDFCDYLDVSMGMSARFARGGEGTVAVALDGMMAARAYRIETGDSVKVTAADSRAAAQALYYLEDLMNLRGAPFLKKGTENRRSMFSPRMTHSGWAVDVFPDAHLAQIAHAGMDAIVIFVRDVDCTKGAAYQDVRDVIRRAKRYGLDTYLYSYVVAFVHPDDPSAKAKFDSTYGRIAAAYPEAKGIVFVGESCQFPTKDDRAQPRTWNNRIPGDKRPTAGWWPCRDYPDWLRAVKASIDAQSKGMEIVFWSYNWGRQPAQPRMELIDALPQDVALMATFEMFEPQVKRNGLNAPSADYSLSFEGPGRYFASEAERAHKRGLRLYSMSNTGGVTWDYGSIPYQPCPFQWKRRYDGIVKAQKEWGLSGLMECHHYGWWPSFVSELEKEAFTEGGIPFETHLRMIAARDFGAENVDRVIEAWRLWSDTARDYVASDANQYGPFRTGPSYPYNFGGRHIANSEFPIPRHASNKDIARYNYLDRSSYNPELGEVGKLDLENMHKELELLEDMRAALGKGADIFDAISESCPQERSEKARRMAGLGRYMQRTVITAINVKHGAIAHRAGDKAGVLEWAKKEYANAKASLPLVEADSRLGWEPSMEYIGGPEQIRWKLDRMVQTYTGIAERDRRPHSDVDRTAVKQVRGVMLSQYTVSEEDFRTLKEWGATVARYQMYPVGERWKGKTSDTEGFASWLDWKLGVLKGEALPLARKYGIPLVVDLHVPPGGRGGSGMKMLDDPVWADFFVDCWRKIATQLKDEGGVYAYDLINEPTQFGTPKVCDYLEIQRRAASAIRKIDATTPIVVSCRNDVAWCAPSAFKWMKPIDLPNIFYQFHMYEPFDYTHQKVLPQFKETVAAYPDSAKGWDAEGLRRIVAPVREFEKRYGARIFVGEFSAVAYAKGCDKWIADVGAMLNEYGWDWCYHAFREWPGWSVEHVVTEGDSAATAKFAPSADNPRRRALLSVLKDSGM